MKFHRLTFAALLILVFGPGVFAQSDRGSITGRVLDPTGAVVPDAKVTATNTETNTPAETKTNDEGNFTFPQLQAAPYRLTVEATGFKTATLDEERVGVQITRSVEIKLEVGGVGDVVNVTADAAPVIQTDTPVSQLNVTERQVRELPLLVSAASGGGAAAPPL